MKTLCCCSLILLSTFISTTFGADAVTSKHAVGSDVVTAAIRRVQDTCIFKNDLLFMRRVAFQESNDGNVLTTIWNTDKGRAGIWQNNDTELSALQQSTNVFIQQQLSSLGVNLTALNWQNGDLEIPLNSIAVARLYVSTFEINYYQSIPYDIPGQAQFWAKNYKTPNNPATAQNFIDNANKMTKCKPPGMDLIFIIDASESIGEYDYQLARDFVISIINSSMADESNRVGVIRFSTRATLVTNLTYDLNAAMEIVQNMFYDNANTNIQAGLDMANIQFTSNGRNDVPQVALLITDGKPNVGTPTGPAADRLKSLGVNLFTIGVGSEATTDLRKWASSPNCMFYYSLEGYTQLATVFPELLNSQICDVSVVASDNQTYVPGSVDKDQALYYQIPASVTDGLTLKLDIHEGAAAVFASLTARHPSLSDHDFSANATTENLGQIYISPELLQQASNNSNMFFVSDMVALGIADVTVYTSVVGISDTTTNFTLHYEKHDTEITTVATTTTTTTPPSTSSPLATTTNSSPKLMMSSFLIIFISVLCYSVN
uniref:VWFA domain-containing protein n=1 Tax=Panagrolaimus davidi TaxID=227884 RepID=A0A914Q676_9BILA